MNAEYASRLSQRAKEPKLFPDIRFWFSYRRALTRVNDRIQEEVNLGLKKAVIMVDRRVAPKLAGFLSKEGFLVERKTFPAKERLTIRWK